ncbi:MAG TPA: carboxypeptidase regulatory-like domain-containing protein [Pirellulales bacterium]|nr:carboxypeptidase regulatory-like domain-containing protein [Pirellulales bacterium]
MVRRDPASVCVSAGLSKENFDRWPTPRQAVSLPTAVFPIVFVAIFAAAGFADEGAKPFVPRGTIVDMDQKPISGAQVSLHRWDGGMSAALETSVTDDDGHFEFPPRPQDAYYYVIIRKASYAPVNQRVRSEGPLKTALRPEAATWIEVRNASDKPLKGARVTNLYIRTPENAETYVFRGMERLLGLEFTESDERGRLNLPPLPVGALIDVRVDHPQWAQAKLSNAKAAQGRLGAVTLPSGVITTFQFVADPRTPMRLDGLTCEMMLLAQSSDSAETLNRIPMTIGGDRFKFCAHSATYGTARLKSPGVVITPIFNRLTLPRQAETTVRFLVRKTTAVSGRVMRHDGVPHGGAQVIAQVENLSPDGRVEGVNKWIYSDSASTDTEGKFALALPPGRSRIEVSAKGFVADRDYAEFEVRADAPNEMPDFIIQALAPIHGRVVDEDGQPVPGAIVRVRQHSLMALHPVVSDAEGRFEIDLPYVPFDLQTKQRRYQLDIAAFVPDRPLIGLKRIDLRGNDSLKSVEIALRSESPADELLGMEDNRWIIARMQETSAEQQDQYPAGQRGQPAPELDGVAWFNTDAHSLKDFRGRYVLLDFWFTACGPCHADFPSVKLFHELFEKLGVTVIGVHDNSSSPEGVREHCKKQGLKFPIVVDHADGRIVNAYRKLGLRAFPTYMLIGPDGNILHNDSTSDGPPLREFKLEVVRSYVLNRQRK